MLDGRPRQRIGLYGPYGWGNLGDASIQEAMMHGVRARRPDAQFVGISLNPDNTAAIHGIEAVSITRPWRQVSPATTSGSGGAAAASEDAGEAGLASALRAVPGLRPLKDRAEPALERLRELRFWGRCVSFLRGLDALVISGGGQFSDDWGGPLDHPYSLLKWMLCGRLAGVPVLTVSVGAGPIRDARSRPLLLQALRLADYRSYRDEGSRQLLARNGFRLEAAVYPDLAFSLPRPAPAPVDSEGPATVGISFLAYHHPQPGAWPEQDAARYQRYRATMMALAQRVLSEGHRVVMFNSQIRNDRFAFDDALPDLQAQAGPGQLDAQATTDLAHLLRQIAATDIVVTSRLHGVILSYLSHKAVLSLSYDPKIDAVMKDFGQSEFCLDIDTCSPALLAERFDAMRQDLPAIRRAIAAKTTAHRQRLAHQYDRLFGPARPGATP